MLSRRKRIIHSGGLPPFSPSQITKVTSWLRNTTTSGNISSVTDQLNSNPATQSVDARRPSGNADGSMTFATNDALVWPLIPANNHTTKFGIAFWMKQSASALETMYGVYDATGGSSARKIFLQTNTARRLVVGAYISGNNGRQAMTAVNALPVSGTAAWLRLAYDSSLGGDANIKIYINGVSQEGLAFASLGSGGTLTILPSPTLNSIIGDLTNSAALVPFNGTIGRNIYILNDDLTAGEDLDLRSFEPLS